MQTKPPSYYQSDLAYVHDQGFGDIARKAAGTLLEALLQQGITEGRIVDLGCGSGIFLAALSGQGYQLTGVEYSPDMLALAAHRVPSAQWVQSSLWDYSLPVCAAVASTGECLNYQFDGQSSLENLAKLFQRIYDCLQPGGIWLFDLIGPDLLGTAGAPVKVVEEEEWTLILRYEEHAVSQTLNRHITLFRKLGDLYRRSDESHPVQLHASGHIVERLQRTGFQLHLLDHYQDLPLRKGHYAVLALKPKGKFA